MKLRDFLLNEFRKHKDEDIYLSFDVLGCVSRENRMNVTVIPYEAPFDTLKEELFKLRDDGLIDLIDTRNMGYLIKLI